jgi:hypothetical protein
MTRLPFERAEAPELPEGVDWHPRTRQWWAAWQRSPMAALMSDIDWAFMADTALLHSAMWATSSWTMAAEVRLRVAKFGATLEDRQRLRLTWADADERDAAVPVTPPSPAEGRYAGLTVVPMPAAPSADGEPGE